MTAPDHGRKLVFDRPLGNGLTQRGEIVPKNAAGGVHLHRQGGVEQIRGGQTLVDPARGGTDMGCHFLQKGDHIVIGAFLDLPHFLNIKGGPGPDGGSILPWNGSQFGHAFAGQDFNFEPDFQFALLRPERAHLRKRVTVNHRESRNDHARVCQSPKFSVHGPGPEAHG